MNGTGKMMHYYLSQSEQLTAVILSAGRIKTDGHVCTFSLCGPDAYCDFSNALLELSGSKTS